MYTIDKRDRLEELTGIPQSSVGAPLPMVMASEHVLILAYYLEADMPWDAREPRLVTPQDRKVCAVVHFGCVLAHTFGEPNDEGLPDHPLYARGLRSYGAYEVYDSSWVRQRARFAPWRHFVFTFHDSTFECLAERFSIKTVHGTVREVLLNAWRDDD